MRGTADREEASEAANQSEEADGAAQRHSCARVRDWWAQLLCADVRSERLSKPRWVPHNLVSTAISGVWAHQKLTAFGMSARRLCWVGALLALCLHTASARFDPNERLQKAFESGKKAASDNNLQDKFNKLRDRISGAAAPLPPAAAIKACNGLQSGCLAESSGSRSAHLGW